MERRPSGRGAEEIRPVGFEIGVQRRAAGSVLVSCGGTRVICAASVEERLPGWLADRSGGWVTAEYGMLPGSAGGRKGRGTDSRATEIQRLIGRSLRAATDLGALPGLTVTVDCDVLEADGGTRTAAITGGWLALRLAVDGLLRRGRIERPAVVRSVAAVSVGVVGGEAMLDLDYEEDHRAEVDLNVVGTAEGGLIEVQGTAERGTFDRGRLDRLLDLAQLGIARLAALRDPLASLPRND